MKIEIDPRKSVQESANDYYQKAKKIKAKIPKLKEAIKVTKQLIKERAQKQDFEQQLPDVKIERKKDWYEKFHWSMLNDYLFIAGRDTKSNTEIVKKHLEKNDLYFHSDVDGAASCVLKGGQKAPEKIKKMAAVLANSFSKAWKGGLTIADSYAVLPEQVKTAAKSGEYLTSGAFVISGKRNYYKNTELQLEVSFFRDKIMITPKGFFDKKFILIKPDKRETKGNSAKKIFTELKRLFPEKKFELDWIIQILPNGGSKIVGVY